MKKIFLIMLVVSLALFSFVSCDDKKEPTVEKHEYLKSCEGNLKIDQKSFDVSDFQSNIVIVKDGKVTGTVKYVDNAEFLTDFWGASSATGKEGYYIWIQYYNLKTNDQVVSLQGTDPAPILKYDSARDDNYTTIYLGATGEGLKPYEQKVEGKFDTVLDFTGLTFEPKPTK